MKRIKLERKRKKPGGFSLVELVITCSILAIAAAFFVPSLVNYKRLSLQQMDEGTLSIMADALILSSREREFEKERSENESGYYVIDLEIGEDGVADYDGAVIMDSLDEAESSKVAFGEHSLYYNFIQRINKNTKFKSTTYKGTTVRFTLKLKTETTAAECSYKILEVEA